MATAGVSDVLAKSAQVGRHGNHVAHGPLGPEEGGCRPTGRHPHGRGDAGTRGRGDAGTRGRGDAGTRRRSEIGQGENCRLDEPIGPSVFRRIRATKVAPATRRCRIRGQPSPRDLSDRRQLRRCGKGPDLWRRGRDESGNGCGQVAVGHLVAALEVPDVLAHPLVGSDRILPVNGVQYESMCIDEAPAGFRHVFHHCLE